MASALAVVNNSTSCFSPFWGALHFPCSDSNAKVDNLLVASFPCARLARKRFESSFAQPLESRGHIGQLAKFLGISERDVPRTLRNIIRDGRIVSSKTIKRGNRAGYERKYEHNGKHIILAAIRTNGFLITAHPND